LEKRQFEKNAEAVAEPVRKKTVGAAVLEHSDIAPQACAAASYGDKRVVTELAANCDPFDSDTTVYSAQKTLPSTRNQQRGIPTAKKDGIIKLMHVVKTSSKLKFWIDLPVNDGVSDLSDSIE
jgi:hypothetical protein